MKKRYLKRFCDKIREKPLSLEGTGHTSTFCLGSLHAGHAPGCSAALLGSRAERRLVGLQVGGVVAFLIRCSFKIWGSVSGKYQTGLTHLIYGYESHFDSLQYPPISSEYKYYFVNKKFT
jgi:hypothetical protein